MECKKHSPYAVFEEVPSPQNQVLMAAPISVQIWVVLMASQKGKGSLSP